MPMQKPAIVGPARFPQLVCRAVVALASAAGAARGQECYYTWERIRDPGGGYCSGSALNNHGVVAGTISYTGDNTRAFTWSADTGLIILPFPPDVVSMEANGINDAGQVVGKMWGGGPQRGFIWDGASYTTIDMPPFSFQIYVNDINNRGEVVGGLYHRYPPGPAFWDPYIWQEGEWTFLGELIAPRTGWANAINERGEMVGEAADAQWHAFHVVDRQAVTWLTAAPGFMAIGAHGINNNGVIAGQTRWPSPVHTEAVVWTASGSFDTYPPTAGEQHALLRGVNDSHRAVGHYYYGVADRAFAAQYGAPTILRDVTTPAPPWLFGAFAINNIGQIVASYSGGSVLLTPHWRAGDVTGDCLVTLADLALVLSQFGLPIDDFPAADVNDDGQVDLTDLATVLIHFGE